MKKQWQPQIKLSHSGRTAKFSADGKDTRHLTTSGRIEQAKADQEIEKLKKSGYWDYE